MWQPVVQHTHAPDVRMCKHIVSNQIRSSCHLWVEIDVGCVPEGLQLLLKSLVDPRMAVTNGHSDDPPKHVQVPPPLVVPQPLHAALVDEQGRSVVSRHRRVQIFFSDLLRPFHGGAFILGPIQGPCFLTPRSSGTERTT